MARPTDPAPAGSGEELALPRGGAFSPSPHLTSPTKSDPPTARGNSNQPTTETRQTVTERLQSVCPECGTPYTRDDNTAACPDCYPSRTTRPNHYGRGSSTARGYDERWRRLSLQARRLSPQCADCGATDDLSADHSAEAWRRREQGLTIRLQDIDVVCLRCNAERGAARGARGDRHESWRTRELAALVDELDREDDELDPRG